MTTLVIDGVFFQLAQSGIARVWTSILRIWGAESRFSRIVLLDRGGGPEIPGIERIPFPRWHAPEAAADSVLIQRMCDHLGAEAFTSTYYTTPLSTPMALMVYDMIPELFGFNMRIKDWMEKETTIAYAQRYLCISHNTRRDLLELYPEIPAEATTVAHCGIETETFCPRPDGEVAAFCAEQGLDRPYFLFVGSRVQHKSYKNSDLFWKALAEMDQVDFDVFCVGGEPEIEQSVLDALPEGVRARRASLTDHELSLAYAGAEALIYPSLYEGFGMPVIEAMASGCPVITTNRGSLAEAAGEAALLVEGSSVSEMARALRVVREDATRAALREKGYAHADGFRWEPMAELMAGQLETARDLAGRASVQDMLAEWARLRQLQADVDHQA